MACLRCGGSEVEQARDRFAQAVRVWVTVVLAFTITELASPTVVQHINGFPHRLESIKREETRQSTVYHDS